MEPGDECLQLSSAVDESRIWTRLMELAEIGREGETGVNRPAYSEGDRKAKRLLVDWAIRMGATAWQDAIGNLFLRYDPTGCSGPPVVTGSHLDSQPCGGRFDGAFGVVAGLEVLDVLTAGKIAIRRPIEVVAWSNEEGGRFAPGAMGSQFFAGLLDVAAVKDSKDSAGVRLEDALSETMQSLPEARLRNSSQRPYAYVEAHIEQGPILESRGREIGIVEGIQGCVWIEYTVRGTTAHAGTTPMENRRDALQQAIRLIRQMERMSLRSAPDCRFTVGRMSVRPDSPNSIPDKVRFTVDFRVSEPELFKDICTRLLGYEHAGRCSVETRVLFEHAPQQLDANIVDKIRTVAARLGFDAVKMTSGAFHDALFVSEVCRTGMLFVPCKAGISHHADEYSSPRQLADGTRVLAAAVLGLATE